MIPEVIMGYVAVIKYREPPPMNRATNISCTFVNSEEAVTLKQKYDLDDVLECEVWEVALPEKLSLVFQQHQEMKDILKSLGVKYPSQQPKLLT